MHLAQQKVGVACPAWAPWRPQGHAMAVQPSQPQNQARARRSARSISVTASQQLPSSTEATTAPPTVAGRKLVFAVDGTQPCQQALAWVVRNILQKGAAGGVSWQLAAPPAILPCLGLLLSCVVHLFHDLPGAVACHDCQLPRFCTSPALPQATPSTWPTLSATHARRGSRSAAWTPSAPPSLPRPATTGASPISSS